MEKDPVQSFMCRVSFEQDVNNVDDMQKISDARRLKGVSFFGKGWEDLSVLCQLLIAMGFPRASLSIYIPVPRNTSSKNFFGNLNYPGI